LCGKYQRLDIKNKYRWTFEEARPVTTALAKYHLEACKEFYLVLKKPKYLYS
jgi:hypothetical protein